MKQPHNSPRQRTTEKDFSWLWTAKQLQLQAHMQRSFLCLFWRSICLTRATPTTICGNIKNKVHSITGLFFGNSKRHFRDTSGAAFHNPHPHLALQSCATLLLLHVCWKFGLVLRWALLYSFQHFPSENGFGSQKYFGFASSGCREFVVCLFCVDGSISGAFKRKVIVWEHELLSRYTSSYKYSMSQNCCI